MIGISFHTGGFVDRPLPWVLEHLATVGYDGVEIVCGPEAHIRTGEPLGPQLAEAKALLKTLGLKVAAINPYTAPAMVNYAREDMAGAERYWGMLLDIAVELGASKVNFLPGWLSDGDRPAWELLIRILKTLTARAERLGVNLAIHNHESMIIDAPGKCKVLIEQVGSPNLKVLCDITNFYILGSDVAEAVRDLAPHIVHCHVKGVVGKYPFNSFLVPGEEGDELPFAPFAEALGEIGYGEYVSVETFKHMREDKAELAYAMISECLRAQGLRP